MIEIFVHNNTVLDCAFLDFTLGPMGCSWLVSATLGGKQNANGMLTDFSRAKSLIKNTVDDLFDHKLIVPDSLVSPQLSDSENMCVSTMWEIDGASLPFLIHGPRSFFSQIPAWNNHKGSGKTYSLVQVLEQEISNKVAEVSADNITNVRVMLNHPEASHAKTFSYIHSLPNHLGNCQRFHGHSGLLQVVNHDNEEDETLTKQLLTLFNHKYFINKKYIVSLQESEFRSLLSQNYNSDHTISEVQEELYGIKYVGSKGTMKIILPRKAVVVLDSESTIESMAIFFHKHLSLPQGKKVIAFEGIHKGAIFGGM